MNHFFTKYWWKVVHFNIHTHIKHVEQNVVKGQGHSTNTLKSLFLAQVVISCHIADFNVSFNKSILWTI